MLDVELAEIDRKTRYSRRIVITIALLLPASYAVWFGFHGIPVSLSSSDWGTLGDFLGGVLNPIIAFSAFMWLTMSVRLQKEELAYTRSTLQEASNAQKDQVQLAALTALTSSIMTEVNTLNTQLTYMCGQFKDIEPDGVLDLHGVWVSPTRARDIIADINQRISVRLSERATYETQIKVLLT